MLHLLTIGSGSKGNSTIIYNEDTTILIDCGVSKAKVVEGLSLISKKLKDIQCVFFTHNHIDHVRGIDIFDKNIEFACKGAVDLLESNELEVFKTYNFGSVLVMPLLTSHDAPSACGYRISDKESTLIYMTDTGFIPEESLQYMKDADLYFIESNHDISMLLDSHRPNVLKSRILSYKGHMSNEQSAEYMCDLIGPKTKEIILGHLSEECNSLGVALNTYYEIFRENKISIDDVVIYPLRQWEFYKL
jgi:phosphoribosyl 1,2-cyclic phosphodiesterase